ncbi:hypothetical protein SLA2020_527680 [Shorea laevis]
MANNVVLLASSSQQAKKGDLNLFAFSDHEIMNQIYATHVHDDEKFDVESLFIVVENTLKRATQVADNIVLGTQGTVEHLEEKTPKATFSAPLCTLKSISCEMQLIECIFELEKLSNYDTKDVPALSTGMDHIPVDVFWAIVTVVASTTQLCCLTSDDDKKQELSQQQIEETEAYWKLTKLFRTPTEIMEVTIEVLKKKNVLLFISGLDITDEDISILRPVYDSIKKDDQYKIVWIPIVDQWTDELQKKFEFLRSKMPWYVVQCFSPIAGIRFVKEKWNFKGKPSIVVLNPQGKVEHENAIHMIRVWGIKAFPFTTAKEETLSNDREWIGSIATNVHPNIENFIKDQKYIFFYGGKDNEWIQQFTKRATVLANDATLKEARIAIELVCVGKGSKGEDNLGVLGRFWTGIESIFISKTHRKTDADSVVEDFEKWKEFVREKGFEFTFKEYHNRVLHTAHICCRIDIPNTSGRIPENMKCPDCPRIMETYISFKCCHIDGAANGVH